MNVPDFFVIFLLPPFLSCPFPFSSDSLVLGTLGLELAFIRLPRFVQRCARRECLRGTCISVRARWTTQGVRLEIPCAPERDTWFFSSRDMCQRIAIILVVSLE